MTITEHLGRGKMVLTLSGRMDFQARHSFHQAIERTKCLNVEKIVLNISHVPFIDSAGLGWLMLAHKTLGEVNMPLSLEVSEGYVRDVLMLTNIGQKIPVTVIQPELILKTAVRSSASESSPDHVPLKPPLVFESAASQETLLPILEKLEQEDLDIPPLSNVARRVLELTNDPEAHASHLIDLIQGDPILTAKIFQVSNSAAYGTRNEITTVQQAITWLGLNSVAGIALALSVQTGVFNDRGYEREVRDIWAHAIATALFAKALAGMIGKNPDTAFLCGLFHSLGKLFVVHTVNQSLQSAAQSLSWSEMLTLIDQSYMEVGRHMAESWNLPTPVKEAISLHPHFSYHLATDPSHGSAITCLARYLARYHLDSVAISVDMLRMLPVTTALEIPPDALNGILEFHAYIQVQIESLLL